jgi:hypothetical protein
MDKWLVVAHRVNAFRVFPRIYLTVFFIAYVCLFAASWEWYTGLDLASIEPTNLAFITAFPVALLTALGGMFTKMYISYQGYKSEPPDGE